jgi:ribosomal protein S18 acetylase RimI-like enzyme
MGKYSAGAQKIAERNKTETPMETKKKPGSDVKIREFLFPDDYPAALHLWQNAGPGIHVRKSDEPEEIQKKLERDPELFLVAEADGKMIGTVLGGFDGRRGLIYHLAVEAETREAGVGGLLMEELERRLKAKGCLKCYLLVTSDNESAIRFYAKRGWDLMDGILTYTKTL